MPNGDVKRQKGKGGRRGERTDKREEEERRSKLSYGTGMCVT